MIYEIIRNSIRNIKYEMDFSGIRNGQYETKGENTKQHETCCFVYFYYETYNFGEVHIRNMYERVYEPIIRNTWTLNTKHVYEMIYEMTHETESFTESFIHDHRAYQGSSCELPTPWPSFRLSWHPSTSVQMPQTFSSAFPCQTPTSRC